MARMAPNAGTPVAFSLTLRRLVCLGLVGGYLNAIGFIDLGGLYPAAMTGNTTQLGVAIVKFEWMRVFLIGSTVFCFFMGGILSSYLQRAIVHPSLELVLMIVVVSAAQFVRMVTNDPVPWELPLLACGMAMQGETLSRFSGSSIQTIVVTNTLLKFADALVGRYLRYDKARRTSLVDVIVPGSAWTAYLIGAGSGVVASMFLQYALLPAIVLLGALSLDVYVTGTAEQRAQEI